MKWARTDHQRATLLLCLTIVVGLPGCTLMRRVLPGTTAAEMTAPESPINQAALSSSERAVVCLQTGLQLAASEKDDHAIAQLKKARGLDPDLPGVAHPLAVLYDRQGQFGFAELEYERALKEGPPSADLLNDVGFFRYTQGNFADARRHLEQARETSPRHHQATLNLALVCAAEHEFDAAMQLFEQVVGPAAAHQNMGLLLLQDGQYDQAGVHLHKAVELDPSLDTAATVLSRLSDAVPSTHRLAAVPGE